jgi:hypothetical protein
MLAGGGVYNNLDYSYTVGHEDGTAQVSSGTPGGGGESIQNQLGYLRAFMDRLNFVQMQPDNAVIKKGVPSDAAAYVLSEQGAQYAVYIRGGSQADLVMDIPKGSYIAEWINTKSGNVDKKQELPNHAGGEVTVSSPAYSEDIALRILADSYVRTMERCSPISEPAKFISKLHNKGFDAAGRCKMGNQPFAAGLRITGPRHDRGICGRPGYQR